MQFSTHHASSHSRAPRPNRVHKRVFLTLLIVVLLLGCVGGGIVWFKKQQSHQEAPAEAPTAPTPTPLSLNPSDHQAVGVHYVTSIGYPFDMKGKQVTIKLGLPDSLQAVRSSSTNQDRGQEQYFTDKYNDELGRWAISNPTFSHDATEFSVLAISKSWLAATQDVSGVFPRDQLKLNTPTEKRKFISDLKAKTQKCVTETAKGFTTADKNMNVCFTLSIGQEAYSPVLNLEGYAEVAGQPLLLTGAIRIEDSKTQALSVDENHRLLNEVKGSEKVPQSTQLIIAEIVDALTHTTIEVK